MLAQVEVFVNTRSFKRGALEEKETQEAKYDKIKLPPWDIALEIIEETGATRTAAHPTKKTKEKAETDEEKNEKIRWYKAFLAGLSKRLLYMAACVVVLYCFNIAINFIIDNIFGWAKVDKRIIFIISAVITWLTNKELAKYTDGEDDLVEVCFKMVALVWRTIRVIFYLLIEIKLIRYVGKLFSEAKGR